MSDLHSLFFLLRMIEIVVSHHVMVSVELVAHQLLLRSMTWAAGGTYIVISHRPWIKISAELARPLSLNPLKCSRCRQRLNHCRFEQLTTAHFVVNFGIKVKSACPWPRPQCLRPKFDTPTIARMPATGPDAARDSRRHLFCPLMVR